MNYLFVHFREKATEDGEQIYFAVSKDGYAWNSVNNGKPIITATKGDKGVRDITIVRTKENSFVIMATDLALVRNIDTKYKGSIKGAFKDGSKAVAMWKSDDLVNWSDEMLVELSDGSLGCFWAPGIFFDDINDEYIVHWSSTDKDSNFSGLNIYYSKTKDFKNFSKPEPFYKKSDSETLDSFICKNDGLYHFFVKSASNPKAVMHKTSKALFGPYEDDKNFDLQMSQLDNFVSYEAPMVYKLSDGKFCLMLDFYGCEEKENMGYVPFVTDSLDDVRLNRSDGKFSFPYGFKHGVVIEISDEEYSRIEQIKVL